MKGLEIGRSCFVCNSWYLECDSTKIKTYYINSQIISNAQVKFEMIA